MTGQLYRKYDNLPISPQLNVISILHKIVAAVWFENTGERERRLERRRELRRLRQSGESVVVREGRLERRREQGRRHLAN